jgi:hypothetical protein
LSKQNEPLAVALASSPGSLTAVIMMTVKGKPVTRATVFIADALAETYDISASVEAHRRNPFVADSPLEGTGFEPSVPPEAR